MNVALITGVTSGIGNTTARVLVERGYRVRVFGRPRRFLPTGVFDRAPRTQYGFEGDAHAPIA